MTEPDEASSDATNIAFVSRKGRRSLGAEWRQMVGEWRRRFSRCQLYIVMALHGSGRTQAQPPLHVPDPGGCGRAGSAAADACLQYRRCAARPYAYPLHQCTGSRSRSRAWSAGAALKWRKGRLGPGRIHHCMRAIGQAERALELLCKRALSREAFGKKLADLGANHDIIANARMEIEMARLLCASRQPG